MISKNPQRAAWLTILTGFVFFCLICISSVYGAQWFIFDSSANLVVTAYVAQGTMTIDSPDNTNRQAIQAQTLINNEEIVRTDNLSQGYLNFANPFGANETFTTVQLMPGSQIELTRATRSRFGIGETPIIIQLDGASGEFNINISANIEQDIHVEVRGHNQTLRLDDAGYFIVNISETDTSIVVREGQAIFVADNGSTKLLQKGQHGIYRVNESVMRLSTITNYKIVPDSIAREEVEISGDDNGPRVIWGCQTDQEQLPRSNRERIFYDDRYAEHFWRDGSQNASASCATNETSISIGNYDSLKIRATMYLSTHSLNGCGINGSECVLMLKMTYRSQTQLETQLNSGVDERSTWFRGFYIDYNPASNDRIRCDSCFKDHIEVNGKVWFTFESDDFVLDIQNIEGRPVEIIQLEFYSSGHSFDAYVSEFSVIGIDFDAE